MSDLQTSDMRRMREMTSALRQTFYAHFVVEIDGKSSHNGGF